jgi:nucleoside phosphorylase
MHSSLNPSVPNFVVVVPTPWEATAILDEVLNGLEPDAAFHERPYPVFSQTIRNSHVIMIVSYIAPHNAAGAVGWAIGTFEPKAIFIAGSAGALTPDLYPGDVVIGSSVRTLFSKTTLANRMRLGLPVGGYRYLFRGKPQQGNELDADPVLLHRTAIAAEYSLPRLSKWPDTTRSPQFVTGCIGSMDDWTTDPEELERFHSEGVFAQDMESAPAAMVAASHGVPFIAIRGISNNGLRNLQPTSLDEVKASSTRASVNAGEVLGTVLGYTDEDLGRI